MIAYAIEKALTSGLFDDVLISTDCDEIAALGVYYGASVPFMRPASLADDHTGTGAVICHAIEYFKTNGQSPDYLCCIYPTCPLLLPDDLQKALEALIKQPEKDFAFSSTRYAFPIQRAFILDDQGHPEMLFPEHLSTRSQDLPEAFHDAGQFYWGKPQAFLQGISMFSQQAIPYIMPRARVMDIDTEEDWQDAELLYRLMQSRQR